MAPAPVSERLPAEFLDRLRPLLATDEFEAFVRSFDQARTVGVRINPSKSTAEEVAALLGIDLVPVPWAANGYLAPTGAALGGHPAHLSGLYYLQEPSAMAVGAAAGVRRGDVVIDLAAAPGGKTTHLAALVGPSGLVVANEVSSARRRALHDNLDLWGADNVVTAGVAIEALAATEATFDRVVLDAPCSGEALFRRDPSAIDHWSTAAVDGVARRQRALLGDAARLVEPGGSLTYSTCSFGVAENEAVVADLLEQRADLTPAPTAADLDLAPGVALPGAATERTARLWPHRHKGEGQYLARLDRSADSGRRPRRRPPSATPKRRRHGRGGGGSAPTVDREAVIGAWTEVARHLELEPGPGFDERRLVVRHDRLWLRPEVGHGLDPATLARPGLPLGRLRPGRFEPHLALAASLTADSVAHSRSWDESTASLHAYLAGEALGDEGDDGWVLICYRRWGVGWARRRGGVLKNLYPRHLRRIAAANRRR